MVGQATVRKWRYAFNCRGCLQICELHDGVHEGNYCMPMLRGEDPIHADEDRIVRCDAWSPAQIGIFEETGEEDEDAEG